MTDLERFRAALVEIRDMNPDKDSEQGFTECICDDRCAYCGCREGKHTTAAPSTDGWHYCGGCGQSHVFRAKPY